MRISIVLIFFFFFSVPPPTYDSLFGRVREVQKSSNGVIDFVKNLIILFLGTSEYTFLFSPTNLRLGAV